MFGVAGFGAAMLGALWGYDGWNNLTLVAGEVKDPQRNIPRALIFGMFVIITAYVFVNIAYFYALTPTEVASVSKASSVAREVAVNRKDLAATLTGIQGDLQKLDSGLQFANDILAVELAASAFGTGNGAIPGFAPAPELPAGPRVMLMDEPEDGLI